MKPLKFSVGLGGLCMVIAIIGSVVSGCSVKHQPEPKQTISMELLSEDWEAYSETFAKVRYGNYDLCELPR